MASHQDKASYQAGETKARTEVRPSRISLSIIADSMIAGHSAAVA
jgi:hypothetical protein